jgi:hypothetical protein
MTTFYKRSSRPSHTCQADVSQSSMIKYTEATKRPYVYLFIDLKQNTPEEDRLKTDIFDSVPNNKSCSPNMVGLQIVIFGTPSIHMLSQIWYIFKLPSRVVTRRHFLFNMFMIFSQSLSNTSVHFIFNQRLINM